MDMIDKILGPTRNEEMKNPISISSFWNQLFFMDVLSPVALSESLLLSISKRMIVTFY